MTAYQELISRICGETDVDAVTVSKVLRATADVANQAGTKKGLSMFLHMLELAERREGKDGE